MRKLLVFALLVLIAGIAFAYSGLGKSTPDNYTRVSVPVCDWSKIENGDVFPLCFAADRDTLYIDGGRYEWNVHTGVLTDFGK